MWFFPLVSIKHNVNITDVIHTKTQDGKGLCDAHFAHRTAALKRFLKTAQTKQVAKIKLETALCDTLCFQKHRFANTAVQLFKVDCERLQNFSSLKSVQKIGDEAKEYYSRANHYVFETESFAKFRSFDMTNPENWARVLFRVRVILHSSIRPGALPI